jgi:hypothetical protein
MLRVHPAKKQSIAESRIRFIAVDGGSVKTGRSNCDKQNHQRNHSGEHINV